MELKDEWALKLQQINDELGDEAFWECLRVMFHIDYYGSQVWNGPTRWFGYPVYKPPSDCWVMQEIMFETKPNLVVETGTLHGGSTLFFACICDYMESYYGMQAKVISIDIDKYEFRAWHPRIIYLHGSSTDPRIVKKVKAEIKDGCRVMVILDSSHKRDHVLNELNIYGKMVTPGQYLIVEDTNLHGNPIFLREDNRDWGPGPNEALKIWLPKHKDFRVDESREKYRLTFHPGGYLKRNG